MRNSCLNYDAKCISIAKLICRLLLLTLLIKLTGDSLEIFYLYHWRVYVDVRLHHSLRINLSICSFRGRASSRATMVSIPSMMRLLISTSSRTRRMVIRMTIHMLCQVVLCPIHTSIYMRQTRHTITRMYCLVVLGRIRIMTWIRRRRSQTRLLSIWSLLREMKRSTKCTNVDPNAGHNPQQDSGLARRR